MMCPTDNFSQLDNRRMKPKIPEFIKAPGYAFCRQTGGLIAPGETVLLVWEGKRKLIYSQHSKLYRIVEFERKKQSNGYKSPRPNE